MVTVKIEPYKMASMYFENYVRDGHVQDLILNRAEDFDPRFTTVSKEAIAVLIGEYHDSFKSVVSIYKPFNPFSAAYATTYTGNYNVIKLNSRKLVRSKDPVENMASLIGSIAHEWGHCLEYYIRNHVNQSAVFNHGDNSPVGKENTFQYWLGKAVKEEYMKSGEFNELLRYT